MSQQIGRVGEIAKSILTLLGEGAVVASSLVAPNAMGVFSPLLAKQTNQKADRVASGLRYTMQQGWVAYRERNAQFELYLTKAGKARWQKVELDRTLTSKQWDGKWRIVIFDIPSKRRLHRDALRNHLKKVGFRQLQESVWINPYECADLITALKLIYKLKDAEVKLIVANSFDGERAFAELFHIGR